MDHRVTCAELRNSPAYLLASKLVDLLLAPLPRGRNKTPAAQAA